jgi:preprotein translocase subunit SecG
VTIFLTVLHVMVCVVLVVVVLLQHGKGADIGAVFGGGASNTVFGSRGAGNFLTRLTTTAALLFMVTSLVLSYIANTDLSSSLFDEDAPPAGVIAPAPAETPGEGAAPGGFEEIPAPDAGAAAPAAEGAAAAPSAEAEPPATAGSPADAPAIAEPAPAQEAPATP